MLNLMFFPNYLWLLVLTTYVNCSYFPLKEPDGPNIAPSQNLNLHENKVLSFLWLLIKIWWVPHLPNKPSDWQVNNLFTVVILHNDSQSAWSLASQSLAREGIALLNESGVKQWDPISDHLLGVIFSVVNEKLKDGSCLLRTQFIVMKSSTFST